jgi:hypothetical protein
MNFRRNVFFLLALLLAACTKTPDEPAPPPPPKPAVKSAPVGASSMTKTIRGRRFEAGMDWVAYLRDAIDHPDTHPELRSDLTVSAGLSELASALGPSGLDVFLAGAALDLLEAGDRRAVQLRQLPLKRAIDAEKRILALLRNERDRLKRDNWLVTLLEKALEMDEITRFDVAPEDVVEKDDSTTIALLRQQVSRKDRDDLIVELSAKFDPDWFARNLRKLIPTAQDPDGELLFMAYTQVPEESRAVVLDGIANAGDDFAKRLVRALLDPSNPPSQPLGASRTVEAENLVYSQLVVI